MNAPLKHVLFLITLLVLAVSTAQAAGIIVDGTTCTLADAITAANTDMAAGGCPAGSGADIITLETDVMLAALLPEITSVVIIEGHGHTINGHTLGSVLHIASSGVVTVNKAVITGGNVACYCGTNGSIQYGGGIYNEGQLSLSNSTVSGNRAGGIHNNMGILTITNSTVSKNVLAVCCIPVGCIGVGTCRRGEGIYMSGGTATLRSSIVSGNFGLELDTLEGTITADSYNVFGHSGKSNAEAFYGFSPGTKDVNATSDGTQPTSLAAILTPLADNGGGTLTHALPAGSPAIDLDTTCSTKLTTDQRGVSRPVGADCDAGAFEFTSVNNLPVANAGTNQSAVQGDTVCFDGSGSSDADNDPLSYLWTLTAWPAGSTTELDNPTAVKPCITADLPGTYQVSLVVNDGTVDSVPSIAEAVAISRRQAVIMTLQELMKAVKVNALNPVVFKNKNMGKPLTNQINAAIALINQYRYSAALAQLQDTLGKTDGCAASGAPDSNDWIKDCASQAQVYPLIQEAIGYLEDMI